MNLDRLTMIAIFSTLLLAGAQAAGISGEPPLSDPSTIVNAAESYYSNGFISINTPGSISGNGATADTGYQISNYNNPSLRSSASASANGDFVSGSTGIAGIGVDYVYQIKISALVHDPLSLVPSLTVHLTGLLKGSLFGPGATAGGSIYVTNSEDGTNAYAQAAYYDYAQTSYFTHDFSSDLVLKTGTVYDVDLYESSYAEAYLDGASESHTFLDPYFTVDPKLANSYAIELSPGISNLPDPISAVPLPSTASLFGAALLGLGAVGYGVRRMAASAA